MDDNGSFGQVFVNGPEGRMSEDGRTEGGRATLLFWSRPMQNPSTDPAFLAAYEVLGTLGRGGMGEVLHLRHRV